VDYDDGIASEAWDFGDGTTGSGREVDHTYSAPGTYTVVLTVTDKHGLKDSYTGQAYID
jgi:PKD repeat protein